jgi:hypothetical protein
MNDLKTPVARLLRLARSARDGWKDKALERQQRLRGGCQGSCHFNPFAQNLIGLAAQTHIRGLATLAAWTVGSVKRGCRAVGRSLRTPPSLPSPRTGSRSFVLAALRFAAGAPP